MKTLELRNMVYVDELDGPVDLVALAEHLEHEYVTYEPEQFPSLDYRPPDEPGLFKIFSSGKVTLTGTTNPSSVEERFAQLQVRLRKLVVNETEIVSVELWVDDRSFATVRPDD